jgi:hypothetical protein
MHDDEVGEGATLDRLALAEALGDASRSIERVRALEVQLALAEDELASARHEQEMLRLRLADCERGQAPEAHASDSAAGRWPRRRP